MFLIKNKADLNVVNKNLETPLALASVNILKQLNLEEGITNRKDPYTFVYDNNKLFWNDNPEAQKLKFEQGLCMKYDEMNDNKYLFDKEDQKYETIQNYSKNKKGLEEAK